MGTEVPRAFVVRSAHPRRAGLIVPLVLCGSYACAPGAVAQSPDPQALLARAEARYLDAADAYVAGEAIGSGLMAQYDGRDAAAWRALRAAALADVQRLLPLLHPDALATADDRRALALIASDTAATGDAASFAPAANCTAARRRDLDAPALRAALYACFDRYGRAIPFEGRVLTRAATFDELAVLEPAARRRALFLALQPLWRALNGRNEPTSPYRRMLRATVADPAFQSPVVDAARSLGIAPADVERWLVAILEAWSAVDAGARIEPWDYRWRQGAALRALKRCVPSSIVVDASKRYYRDLGIDLDALGVVHDAELRPGKAPLAYTMAMRYGREVDGAWRPALVRVSSNVSVGGLVELNEQVHEDGHAVQYLAARGRPAFVVDHASDSLYWEAFADVPSWSTWDPAWQQKYLGCAATAADSLRAQYGQVMLDVAWGLYDVRMLQDPRRDPNAVWTEITSRYLHVVPHPELSWWAARVQLVETPGYMVTYALGAALTSDLRARTTAGVGEFAAGNARWYPWLQGELLGAGSRRASADTLAAFLGRAPSADALLADLRRTAALVR